MEAENKKEFIYYFKKFLPGISLLFLFLIILLAVYVRTPNISNLKDVTTGNYTLGPDLDPFLYLRNAQEIIKTGTLASPDKMWMAPLGTESYAKHNLMPWAIVGIYKFLNLFKETSLEYSAIILPVILFAITLIFFFLFIQKTFSFFMKRELSHAGAIIATLIYAVIPEMLHRTTAGIPEIESLGMVFFWMAFYFFIIAWNSEKLKKGILFSMLAGISTLLMIFSWGGFRYIFMAFSLAVLFSFFFQKISRKNVLIYGIWWGISILGFLLKGISISGILSSVTDGLFSTVVLFVLVIDLILFETPLKNKTNKLIEKWKIKFPRSLISLIISFIFGVLIIIFLFGPDFILNKFQAIFDYLLKPFGSGRIGLTVAENQVPYFTQVSNTFAVTFMGINFSLFWTFFFGTILMFYSAIKHFNKKNKWILFSSFVLFLIMFIFSRYSPTSLFNGDNAISKIIYFGGLIIFAFGILYVYIQELKNKNLENSFDKIKFGYLLLISLIFFAIISMRGAVRLFFIISPPMIIASTFLPIKLFDIAIKEKIDWKKYLFLTFVLISVIFLTIFAVNYAKASYYETKYTIPGAYQQQWQYTMSWVRENTKENSIFVHWWDYGYWIQTIGERPTVTDGGHVNSFWDHTTARYLMTAENENTTLQLCKAHNVSYILFDSSDIGKYSAYSSIASDITGQDRLSYIPTVMMDESQTQETKNETIYVYTGGFWLDQDLIWNNELLPQGNAIIAGFLMHEDSGRISNIEEIVYYNNKRYSIPINYVYLNNQKIKLSEKGIDGVFYFVPKLNDNGINPLGTAFFISEKVTKGQFAKMYLLNETNIPLVHKEDSYVIKQLRDYYNMSVGDFIYTNDLSGPIKIFEVTDNLLENINYYPEYLQTTGWDEINGPFAPLDYLGK